MFQALAGPISRRLFGELPGAHVKNLFLRNRKGAMWLLTCLEDRTFDLKQLGRALGVGSLSFASPERLMRHLGVIPGAVTPFAVVNDAAGAVEMLVDRLLLCVDQINLHPLDNAMTTAIAPGDLLRFLQTVEHTPTPIDLDGLKPGADT